MAKEEKVTSLPRAFHLGTQKVLSECKGSKDILQMRLNKSSECNSPRGKACEDGERAQQGLMERTSCAAFRMEGGYIEAKWSGPTLEDDKW